MDYMAHYEKSPRMWSQGLHAHDCYEIYIHLDGGRLYCVDDVVYGLKPNQLLVIPPLHMHGLVCDRDLVDYERCYLYISPEMLQKCGMGKIDLASEIDEFYGKGKIICGLSEKDAVTCKNCLTQIEQLTETDEDGHQLEIFSYILLFLQIMEKSMEGKTKKAIANSSDNLILQVLHYINENYTQDISIESISRMFHVSESSLAHKFKEYVNKSIYDYVLYRRIIKAKELMSSDLTLTEIAYQCGFSDYSNFLRIFKKYTNESPRKYRTGH